MRKFNKDKIETLSDVFASWIGGIPEDSSEIRKFIEQNHLNGLITTDDVEVILLGDGFFDKDTALAIYSLLPTQLKLKDGREYALFSQTFNRLNYKAAKNKYSKVINVNIRRSRQIYEEYYSQKQKYIEENRNRLKHLNDLLTNPNKNQEAYKRAKSRMSDDELELKRAKARERMRKYRMEHPENTKKTPSKPKVQKTSTEIVLEKIAQRTKRRKYREANKEKINEQRKQRRLTLKEENPELLKERDLRKNRSATRKNNCHEYYLRHKEEILQKAKDNPKVKEYKRRYKIKQRLKKTGPIISSLLQGIINNKEK